MKCRCGYRFTFNPKSDRMSDGKFAAILRKASANDTYFFTFNQFYSAYCERISKFSFLRLGVGAGIGLLLLVTLPFSLIVLLLLLIPPLKRKYAAFQHGLGNPPSVGAARKHLEQWLNDGNTVERYIRSTTLHDPPPAWTEPDIYDYGVEGVLIVEHDILVDLLVKNNFHVESRVLVVSEQGYPNYLAPLAWKLIAQRPDLIVYLLHDSTPQGVQMRERVLAREGDKLRDRAIVDLGISPEIVARLKRLKHVGPKRLNYAIPVDYLKYGALALGLSQAIAKNMDLSATIQKSPDYDHSDVPSGTGGFIALAAFGGWVGIADGNDEGVDGDFG